MIAMVLAAGFGTRLRPYSLQKPKPLFPVLNKPLLQRNLLQLSAAGFRTIVVNGHYQADSIRQFLKHFDPSIIFQHEELILGTGGGMKRALQYFTREPVLVVNGDIYHNINLQRIYQLHRRSGTPAVSLVLHDYSRFNSVFVAGNRVVGFERFGPLSVDCAPPSAKIRKLAFTGIQVISPQILSSVASNDGPYDIIDAYRHYLRDGGTINGIELVNPIWFDIGTPEDYLNLHEILIRQEHLPPPAVYSGSNVSLGHGISVKDWICIGDNVSIGDNCRLNKVVIWDNVMVPENSCLENTIVTPMQKL